MVRVARIITNNPTAGVLDIAKKENIPSHVVDVKSTVSMENMYKMLEEDAPSLIVLAGYMKKIPAQMVARFNNKIINIHPALLPKYGGKGMYGMHVHEAVIHAGDSQSGITIHYVNEQYDEGAIILQATCDISKADTPVSLAAKVHALEHAHYPKVIAKLLLVE